MKKFLKILAVAAIAVAAAIACVFAGCNNGGDSSSDYNFTIVYKGGDKDGKPVNGQTDGNYTTDEEFDAGITGTKVAMQLCVGDNCLALTDHNLFFGANGKFSISQAKVNNIFGSDTDVTEFEFHVIGVKDYNNNCSVNVTGKGNYTLEVTLN